RSAFGRDHDIADVVEVSDQTDPAHVEGLFAEIQDVRADVLVGRRERRQQRPEREPVAAKTVGVDIDLVLSDQSAETGYIDDSVNLLELPFENPVLCGLFLEKRVSVA